LLLLRILLRPPTGAWGAAGAAGAAGAPFTGIFAGLAFAGGATAAGGFDAASPIYLGSKVSFFPQVSRKKM